MVAAAFNTADETFLMSTLKEPFATVLIDAKGYPVEADG
jgi:hypothetical protein